MNGIDISGWQAGIDVSAVDADFVIVKATGGVGYVNPDFRRQADQALESGKLLGLYHFAGDGNAGSSEQEAEHFVSSVADYIGRAVMVLDWEADATTWPVEWAENWLQYVADATDSTPWFYSYSSYINSTDCSILARFPLWLAAYYAGYEPMGYQDDPPIYGGLGAWERCVCYQYSSTGYIGGYGGRLDINKFYGDANDWVAFYNGSTPTQKEFEMTEALFYIDDKHEGYDGGEVIYWSPTAGFCYLEHPDCIVLVKECNPDIAEIHSSKAAPWISRAKQATNPTVAAKTYGKHS